MNSTDQQTGICWSSRSLVSFLALLSVTGLPLNALWPPSVHAAGLVANATVPHPLLGNYRGSMTGSISGIGIPSQQLVASVDQNGNMTISVPGFGTGTVTPDGRCRATSGFVLNQQNLTLAYVGILAPIRNPVTGKVIGVVGVGTWRVTSPGIVGGGKWIIRQTR